jgi:hypothetical protein
MVHHAIYLYRTVRYTTSTVHAGSTSHIMFSVSFHIPLCYAVLFSHVFERIAIIVLRIPTTLSGIYR